MDRRRPRHMIERPKGSGRYYWQPSKSAKAAGFQPRPLGSDLSAAVAEAERLNRQWDDWRTGREGGGVDHGTLKWVALEFKRSRYWPSHPKTATDYEWLIREWLAFHEAKGNAKRHLSGVTGAKIDDWWLELERESLHKAAKMMTMLRQLLNFAVSRQVIASNPMDGLRFKTPPARQHVWKEAELTAFLETAADMDMRSVGLAVLLGANTAQRQADIFKLTWSKVDGGRLWVRQGKGQRTVDVRQTKVVQAALAATSRTGLLVCPGPDGGMWKQKPFNDAFRAIREKTEMRQDLQFRDLRRTCVVWLGEAGAEIPEICGVTGHSLESATRILEVYLPRSAKMAASGIAKLDAARSTKTE